MRKQFVIRGRLDGTVSKGIKTIRISGKETGYAFRIVDFQLYPATDIGGSQLEACASIARGSTPLDPVNPNFDDQALVAVAKYSIPTGPEHGVMTYSVINDLVNLTQDLTIYARDTGGGDRAINFQIKFKSVKLTPSAEATANYQSFTIND